jgi:predicted AAA+ superfamily ATPase
MPKPKSKPQRKAKANTRPAGNPAQQTDVIERIAKALERLAPQRAGLPDFSSADAYVWHPDGLRLAPVKRVNRVAMSLLKGIDRVRDVLVENTERFAKGLPANNALLWGARGMGKSSLVKAAHAAINIAFARDSKSGPLKLIEIHREDIKSLPELMALIRGTTWRFIVFCDDLSFDAEDTTYKSLKALLEGGIEGRPDNVIFYATSNRRHLMSRDMMENERSTAINPGEAVEENVSLSDRFGLWLGFHRCSQDEYLAMVEAYVRHYKIATDTEALHRDSLEWATTRGARSGRVAWQFIQDLAGRLGVMLND